MRSFFGVLLASGVFSAPAFGADIEGPIKQFGLMGTWSPDCSREFSQPRFDRVTFAAPFGAEVRATILDKRDGVLITTVDQITESALVASDEIGIGLHPVTVTRSDGKTASQHDYDNMHLVFQKVGARIEVVRVRFEGLPEIQRSAFFERCPN
ncbi:hypothetical protein [Mesorhizobium sp. NZP2077]|uniref:hypothetical protein n=1 Tax=Mesorhizobium sp. NZP2077 TaxID=2483404 RepID=UPI001557B1B9|nr:hypothetical protein [Mesorhizobium sp. NZP2077]QKC84096.1 hypothetical protein EB232_23100 [Mesorhizobium sp. NZP2077]QKD17639.1 hypothetical protein HGP13_22800 [Mesorhizobium sp. NZP2077]